MSAAVLTSKLQALLSADHSPPRAELTWLAFDALAALPMSVLLGDREVLAIVLSALTRENTARVLQRHVVPGANRFGTRLEAAEHKLRDLLPTDARAALVRGVASGTGPRFSWLKGALDPADLRELFAPVIQQVLVQFTSKLPIPGVGGGGSSSGSAGGALGGLVGMLGKQVQKSASQFAEVGKSVMGGLGGELERRMQTLARDFSHTAMGELRVAVSDRLKSAEGQAILMRMRDRAIEHVLNAQLADVTRDMMRLPVEELAQLAPSVVVHQVEQGLLTALLEAELEAAMSAIGQRSLLELLTEAGLHESTRDLILRIVDPGAKALFASDKFGDWLGRLLDEASKP